VLGATLRALGERESALRREVAAAAEGASAAERDLVRLGGAATVEETADGDADALRAEARSLVASADAAAGDAAAAGERARAAENARIDAAVRAGRRRARPHELARVLAGAERLDETLAAAVAAAARFQTPLRARVDAGGMRTGELGEELRRLGAAEVELRQELSAAAERASAIDVEVARIEAEADEARRRLELARLEATAAEPPSPGEKTWSPSAPGDEPAEGDDRDELAERVERLERRRETLGQVNPLAKEEYDAEKLRLDELATQRADLEQSLDELQKLSAELAETVERRFNETFDAVQRHFHEVAATLFPGGEGRLRLTEADDDEELPGIEVELRPAGKKVQRLSLLSGGEKALGAISFLFALFLARPCPFYLLDEVEAALDDTNIGRFVALLRGYADRAQFVVITHQKRTMEAADVLYGVTMGGDGISQIVSRRLPREEAEAVSAA
jgi:chromosome segregation protein